MYSLRGSLCRGGKNFPPPQIPALFGVDPDPSSEVYSTIREASQLERGWGGGGGGDAFFININ